VQKTSNLGPLIHDFRTQHRVSPERNVTSTNKNASVNLQCAPKLDLLSMTFDPKMAKIRSVIVTHPSAAITLQPSQLRHV